MCGRRRIHHQDITCPSLSLLLCYLLAIKQDVSSASDTLSSTQSLSETLTLVSKGNTFELGFFTTSSLKAYLGIWYNKGFPKRTIVWVANRDSPLPSGPTSHLKFSSDGNLGLFDNESNMVWSTGLISPLPSETIEAVILDDGNFVLRDSSRPNVFFWQSFDHPTDTWLPGSRIRFDRITGETKRLVAWKTEDDPSSGMYSLGISRNSNFELFLEWNMSGNSYWNSGFWNGVVFGLIPEISYISKFDFSTNESHASYTYSLFNEGVFSRIIVSSSGQLEQLTALRTHSEWSLTTFRPQELRDVFSLCGPFGMLNNDSKSCSCLTGFVPVSEQVDGCSRRTLLKCENSTASKETKDDGFRELSGMKFPASPKLFPTGDVRSCRSACLNNCSCTAYALDDQGLCLIWDGPLLNSQQLLKDDKNGRSLYVKVSYSELIDDTGKKKKIIEILIGVLVPLAVVLSGGFMGFLYKTRIKKKENVHSGEDLLSFDFNCSNGDSKINREHHLDLPLFSYESVLAATDGFSAQNKLGEGGFGPVYKGNLLNGQEIAIKRLSKRSGQGSEEFRNEILLIAKLQHRNLVRLLGCCNEQDESILIYEYMPNKSLDHFIFDPQKHEILGWRTRIRIINGIAQGLLYLHEHSRLRIIHRDLKLSNVLLDSGMNPKISDFGLARMFDGGDDSSQINTKHIVGTHGYMAPEYVMGGLISTKSDVFSFGVLVLEIISGKRNTGFYNSDCLNLLEHAWELWNSKRVIELLDPTMDVESPAVLTAVLRYINVGLLCVQANPDDRLGMSNVVSMLGSEGSDLLREPKQPAFIARSVVAFNVDHSVNGLTFSTVGPR